MKIGNGKIACNEFLPSMYNELIPCAELSSCGLLIKSIKAAIPQFVFQGVAITLTHFPPGRLTQEN
jgi:hypothetical protein